MAEQVSSRSVRLARRAPLVMWLTLVWLLLWGTFDLKTTIYGLLVALFVSVVFPVPTIKTNLVVRPLRLVRLFAYLTADLVMSTGRVSWQAIRYGPNTPACIVEVQLQVDSDHLIAMIANGVSLAPGKFVMQIDRPNRTCYVYALGTTAADQESVRREVRHLEHLVVSAVGARNQLEQVLAEEKGG